MKQQFCFLVEVNCTNPSKDTFRKESYGSDTPERNYLDCKDGEVYVMAKTVAEVESLLGENIVKITKVGICYSKDK